MQTGNKKRPAGRHPREMEGRRETSDSNGRDSQLQGGSVPRRKSAHSASNIRGRHQSIRVSPPASGCWASRRIMSLYSGVQHQNIFAANRPEYASALWRCIRFSLTCEMAGVLTPAGRSVTQRGFNINRRAVHYHAGNPAKYINSNRIMNKST